MSKSIAVSTKNIEFKVKYLKHFEHEELIMDEQSKFKSIVSVQGTAVMV